MSSKNGIILEAQRLIDITPSDVRGDYSDGYHTFNELYEFRMVYNAALFNEWAIQGSYSVHKSKKHYDGEDCFGGGWFIVVAVLPTGQISNHYELKDWYLFKCDETETAKFEFDGHSSNDVLERLMALNLAIHKCDHSWIAVPVDNKNPVGPAKFICYKCGESPKPVQS